jgi:3'-phosphoadenosine 5'-phosphosulfate sulfotransferase (PAPS reductase)/FAD synthetase
MIISYGGGTNSTAVILALYCKGIRPDGIWFSDTGNEKPETYEFMARFNTWLKSVGFPPISVVRYKIKNPQRRGKVYREVGEAIASIPRKNLEPWATAVTTTLLAVSQENDIRQNYKYESLGEECLVTEGFPSKAYGRGACSMKWKIEPMQKQLNAVYGDRPIRSLVGIHAGETSRLLMKSGHPKELEHGNFFDEYPLIEWGLEQAHCNALCLAILGEIPPKSSCWFCPNMRVSEVRELRDNHPEYYELGCEIEKQAMSHITRSTSIKGLGRRFSWRDLDKLTPLELAAVESAKEGMRCSCID